MFLALLAEIDPAASTMPARRKTLVQRGARSKSASTEPMTMICTMPRSSAIDASFSRWIFRRRARRTTSSASTEAIAACASPRAISVWKSDLSTEHLHDGAGLHQSTGFEKYHALTNAPGLVAIVRDHHASQAMLARKTGDQAFNSALGFVIESRCGL